MNPEPARPWKGVAACLALAAYGAFLVTGYAETLCMMAIPGPGYYVGSYVGASLFSVIGALAGRAAIHSESTNRIVWGLAAAESFAIAAFILSTIAPGVMCAAWPW